MIKSLCTFFLLLLAAPALHAQNWIAPTPEELAMTSIPEVPGAPAVILYKEQTAVDAQHTHSFYERVKILTEGGKDEANVELPYVSGESQTSLDSIAGRTIHADGTIVPFTGKPYEKVVEKMEGYKIKIKVFTLPSVEIGSIIEYRYKLHLDDYNYMSPDWIVQGDLYVRKAHYMWRPTDRQLTTEDGKTVSSTVAWTPILPAGFAVKESNATLTSMGSSDSSRIQLDLDVHDIAPLAKEQFMPPMQSLTYRVMFYYTPFRTSKEYWTSEGKRWNKAREKFIGSSKVIAAGVQQLVAPTDTPDQKLHKIYAAVMTFENTDFTRQRSTKEERAAGLKEINSAEDVFTRKRGSGDQLAELFVAMVRAAGMKAYVMEVADRSERLFLPAYLSVRQLDDNIAIVNVDGKDQYFDPGSRYCTFGQLAWRHGFSGGLRQTDNGTEVAFTQAGNYKNTHVSRIADLVLDDQGKAAGAVVLSYTGDSALNWRHEALRGDETSLKHDLRTTLEHMFPGGMDIKVIKVDNLTDGEQPLKVTYEVKGPIGSSTGKRLLVPANLFETNSRPKFPETKRDQPVDMHFASVTQDAVRFKLPATLVIESTPPKDEATLPQMASFDTSSKTAASAITLYRNLSVGRPIFEVTDYAKLREFYGKIEAKDQETLVLTRANPTTSSN